MVHGHAKNKLEHTIDKIPPSTRSAIRSLIYEVLAFHARQGYTPRKPTPGYAQQDYKQIATKLLFLEIADKLLENDLIERPQFLRGSKFTNLSRSNQPRLFPNYGIPEEITDLIYQTLWELFLQRILSPSTREQPTHSYDFMSLEVVRLTPYGVQILTDHERRIQVHDPDGYLSHFFKSTPPPDPEMMRYLSEGISVFNSGHLLAPVVLLGIASERMIDILAIILRDIHPTGGERWYNEKYKNKRMSQRFKAAKARLFGEYGRELADLKLKEAFDSIVTLTFNQYREARNDIAHPSGRDFTWNEVNGFFHNFVQYFHHLNKIIAFLESKRP